MATQDGGTCTPLDSEKRQHKIRLAGADAPKAAGRRPKKQLRYVRICAILLEIQPPGDNANPMSDSTQLLTLSSEGPMSASCRQFASAIRATAARAILRRRRVDSIPNSPGHLAETTVERGAVGHG